MKSPFLQPVVARKLLGATFLLALAYFAGLLFLFQRGTPYLFVILLIGEVFHVWQLLTLIQVAWDTRLEHAYVNDFEAPIDIYITVAGEPVSVVHKTLRAALAIDYQNFHVYVLNDGYVANKPNWKDIVKLVGRYDPARVTCITRTTPGGAKAGNINHALSKTRAPFVAILDCDHIPTHDFLQKMAGYFVDEKVAFVQAPQYYRNHTKTYVANASWQQQTLFFGPICRGKDRTNSLFMCGTNMIIRRAALEDVGGMRQESITEDLLTSLFIHAHGWRSVYVPRVLARGLAPEDLGTYWQQQFRWARGSFEVLLRFNPLFFRGLTWRQRVQYLASVTYYLTGVVVLLDALLPLVYFYAHQIPISASTMSIALTFIPYIFITLYSLQFVSNFAFSFRAMAFSIASWPIFLLAFFTALLRIPTSFKITSKVRQGGTYVRLALLHIMYVLAIIIGVGFAARRDGVTASLITNVSWGVLYVVLFLPFIRAALSDQIVDKLPYDEQVIRPEKLIHE